MWTDDEVWHYLRRMRRLPESSWDKRQDLFKKWIQRGRLPRPDRRGYAGRVRRGWYPETIIEWIRVHPETVHATTARLQRAALYKRKQERPVKPPMLIPKGRKHGK